MFVSNIGTIALLPTYQILYIGRSAYLADVMINVDVSNSSPPPQGLGQARAH